MYNKIISINQILIASIYNAISKYNQRKYQIRGVYEARYNYCKNIEFGE